MRILKFCLVLLLVSPCYAERLMKQSTATTVNIHLVNASTGVAVTGATVTSITATVIEHSDTSSSTKTDLTVTASGGTSDAVEVGFGDYNLEIPAARNGTLGRWTLCYAYSGAVTTCDSYRVVASGVWDTLVSTAPSTIDDLLETNLNTVASTSAWAYKLNLLNNYITYAAGTIRQSTATDGANTSITLDASASSVDDFYKNARIVIVAGTGEGQSALIKSYVGSTKVATIFCESTTSGAWRTNPASDSAFVILPRNR